MDKPVAVAYPPDKETTIKGRKMFAKANVIVQHNRINGIKVMEGRDGGLVCWAPTGVDISMECRDLVIEAVNAKGLAP